MLLRLKVPAALLTIAVCGCAAKPYQASFNSPLLEPRGTPMMEKSAVIIAVDPVTRENVTQFPELASMVSWREADPGAGHSMGSGIGTGQIQMLERSGLIVFVPLPAFRIRLANSSNQPVSFGSGHVQLEDNLHRQYAQIVDAMTLRGRFLREMSGTSTHIANDQTLMRQFINIIDKLPVLNPGVTIPPGGKWMGYAVFETGAIGPDEYNAWMNSVQNFVLRLQSSGPGGENGPEFAFNLDKQNKVLALTCPSDAKAPSLEKCSRSDQISTVGSGVTRPEGQR